MAEKNEQPTSIQQANAIQEESRKLLEELKKSFAQIDEQLKALETYRKKADDEVQIATQARVKIEEHLKTAESSRKGADDNATFVSQAKAKIEEQLNTVEAFRKKADDETSAYANQFKAKIDEFSKTTESMRKKADEDAQLLVQAKLRFEEKIKEAEDLRKKADESASYANQAKINAEEHSKATAVFKGTAEANLNSIATNKKNFEESIAAVTVGKAAIESDIKMIGEKRKAVEQSANAIIDAAEKGAAQLQKVDDNKKGSDAALKEAQQMRDEAIQSRNKAEAGHNEVTTLSAQAADLTAKVTAAHARSSEQSDEITEILKAAKNNKDELANIIKHLVDSDKTSTEFEARVTKSAQDLEKLIKDTNDLLPGVTSATLASAFGKHKARFAFPKVAWIITFVLCMVGLIAVAYPSFAAAISSNSVEKQWGDLAKSFVMRLPIVLPLVWLAIYAGRNYMLSIRLEEDYAYKEAVSISFEGYKREMLKIAGSQAQGPDNPLTTLCVNVLKAIAERPGRIYEGNYQDITLANEANNVLEKSVELSKKPLATQ